MDFQIFRDLMIQSFNNLAQTSTALFETDVDKEKMWGIYLSSFPSGTNKLYRINKEYDCHCCRHFIKNIGAVVAIKDNKLVSIWDFDAENEKYQPVIDALSEYVKSFAIKDVYFNKERSVGTHHNYSMIDGESVLHSHFYLELPSYAVIGRNESVPEKKGQYRDVRNVFYRSLTEISAEAINTVLELISTNTLYRGNEWERQLKEFAKYKREFDALSTDAEKSIYAWDKSITAGAVIGKIKNHSIGVLLVDITDDVDLDTAVTRYEQIVAPANYKRPKAIFTQKMLDEAKVKLTEMGYLDSLARRYATHEDITVNNILFSNKDSAKKIDGALDVFEQLSKQATSKPKKFSKVEEITADTFIKEILPTATELEVYFENKHSNNLVSLIAPKVADSKTMFKWNNNFSWSYTGNMTDSMMKERVKAHGGKVDGDLRFSIQWNDIDTGTDNNDLDAHCRTPNTEIYFGNLCDYKSNGLLDVDITHPGSKVAVENITWADRKKMTVGTYKFFVHQYANRGGRDGFRAEIEFDGKIYSYDYRRELKQDENVPVAEVTLHADGTFTIREHLESTTASKEIWNLTTNSFIPVGVVCYSPNYWDEQKGNGNKHLFFMLKDCVNPENPNGFFNEYLKEELMEHKRVFEALGSRMKVEDDDNQLSGLGFCLTKRNDIVVKVKGNVERVVKVKF